MMVLFRFRAKSEQTIKRVEGVWTVEGVEDDGVGDRGGECQGQLVHERLPTVKDEGVKPHQLITL